MTGAGLAQAMVFSFMANPASTREGVRQTAVNAGMEVTTQGLDKRMTAKTALFLDSLLAEAVQTVVTAVPGVESLLSRFAGVYVADSTVVDLPEALATVFQGNNGADDAAVKVAVQWELNSGALGLWIRDGTVHDQRTGIGNGALPAGALRLNDLGFFNLKTFATDTANGVYFFSRYKVGTLVYDQHGNALDLTRALPRRSRRAGELTVQLGQERLPCRLLALPVAAGKVGQRRQQLRKQARRKQKVVSDRALTLAAWTLYITNIPPERLQLHEASILGCTRWQIECLFDLWKTEGRLDETRSHNPHRVWCEFYAKLLALLIQHWVMLVGCWHRLDRSVHQATQVIRKRAFCLLDALTDLPDFVRCLNKTAIVLAQACGLSKRASHPLTFQRWLEVAHV